MDQETYSGLMKWFDETMLGQYVAQAEQQFIAAHQQKKVFAIQSHLPAWAEADVLCAGRDAVFDLAALPFATQSVDEIIVPHGFSITHFALELAEVYRVLTPGGRLILTAWNPQALWGWQKICKQYPDIGRSLSPADMKRLLGKQGLSVALGKFMVYVPPLEQYPSLQRLAFLEYAGNRWWPHWAAVYGLVAIKEVAGMHVLPECEEAIFDQQMALGVACREGE